MSKNKRALCMWKKNTQNNCIMIYPPHVWSHKLYALNYDYDVKRTIHSYCNPTLSLDRIECCSNESQILSTKCLSENCTEETSTEHCRYGFHIQKFTISYGETKNYSSFDICKPRYIVIVPTTFQSVTIAMYSIFVVGPMMYGSRTENQRKRQHTQYKMNEYAIT